MHRQRPDEVVGRHVADRQHVGVEPAIEREEPSGVEAGDEGQDGLTLGVVSDAGEHGVDAALV